MSKLSEYFSQARPKPKWFIGDRVYGRINKQLFVGTVLNDSLVYEELGPQVSVYLDLPLDGKSIICVKQSVLRKLKQF